jgi:hypothetical protein
MTWHRHSLFTFGFFFCSDEFKIISPLFITGAAAARPTVLTITQTMGTWNDGNISALNFHKLNDATHRLPLIFFEHRQEHWHICKTRIGHLYWPHAQVQMRLPEKSQDASTEHTCTHTTHTHPAPSGEIPRCSTHGHPDWDSNRGWAAWPLPALPTELELVC